MIHEILNLNQKRKRPDNQTKRLSVELNEYGYEPIIRKAKRRFGI